MAIKTYNYWGCVANDVLALFPHSQECDFGGASVINGLLAQNAREVAQSMRDDIIEMLVHVKHEILVEYATDGQTSATTLLNPIVSGSVHLWKYNNPGCATNDDNLSLGNISGCSSERYVPKVGACEVDTDDYSVDLSSGVVTFDSDLLDEDDRVFISYDVDTEDAAFAVGSCCDATRILTAADISVHLRDETIIEYWRLRAKTTRENMLKGDFIPAELRDAMHWRQVRRNSRFTYTRPITRRG